MPWLMCRWFLFYCISLLMFKDCQSFFLRHTKTGQCIKAGFLAVEGSWGKCYWAEMASNCLDDTAQFRYLNSVELLHNIKTAGTMASDDAPRYKNRLFIYDGKNDNGKEFENNVDHSLKQTPGRSLYFYRVNSCAQPSGIYIDRKKNGCSDSAEQTFTFGSVTAFNSKIKDVHCSKEQRIVFKRADYGDFNNGGTFDFSPSIDEKCSLLTNCQLRARCNGIRSCGLSVDNNMLPSHYCADTSKELYTEYTCVDPYVSKTITTGTNIRLSVSPNEGFIEIKDRSKWRKVVENNWDKEHQKMLCQHLGFNETETNDINRKQLGSGQDIATGDLICYDTQSNETSCCVHLEPSTTSIKVNMPYATCKICDKPLLQDVNTFPDSAFSGEGGYSKYKEARFSNNGWCALGSTPQYLLINLQKQYHITRIVTMGSKGQTKLTGSFSLKYSHNETLVDQSSAVKIIGSKKSHQASATALDIYNVRHLKIEWTPYIDICFRIELCGEVQLPASVNNLIVTASNFSVHLSWTIPNSTKSSYITYFIIYLDGKETETISRKNQFKIFGLKPNTLYHVGIVSEDSNSQKSGKISKQFKTKEAVPSGPPLDVTFKSRGKNSLGVSWKSPDERLWNGVLTGYQVCISTKDKFKDPECFSTNITTFTFLNLKQSTKHFVTVSAGTKIGYGKKSLEISKITNADPVNPFPASYYTMVLEIPKPAEYVRYVMVIVKIAKRNQTSRIDIKTSYLKPSKTSNNEDPYVIAYLKADALPLTFVIGDGKEYNSENEKYFNKPLKKDSSYVVFLRFFESQDLYYSTEWSGRRKTMAKPSGGLSDDQTSDTSLDFTIPLNIGLFCFLLLLGVIVYIVHTRHRRSREYNNNQKIVISGEAENQEALGHVQTVQHLDGNDDTIYESYDDVVERGEGNKTQSKSETLESQELSAYYKPLNENREILSFYQPLEEPMDQPSDPYHTYEIVDQPNQSEEYVIPVEIPEKI